MKKTSLTLAIVFGLLFATILFAQPQKGFGPGSGAEFNPGTPNVGFIAKRLNLTDEQDAQFQDFMTNMKKDAIKIRSQIELKKLDVETLLRSKDFSPEKLMDMGNDLDKLQSDLRKARLTFWSNVYNILDDNQKEMWKNGFLRFMKNAEDFQRMGMRDFKGQRMLRLEKENRMNRIKNQRF
jgi:Spy/CpxP family protein refolding chaperone